MSVDNPALEEIAAIAEAIPAKKALYLKPEGVLRYSPFLVCSFLGLPPAENVPPLSKLRRDRLWQKLNSALALSNDIIKHTEYILQHTPVNGFEETALMFAAAHEWQLGTPEEMAASDLILPRPSRAVWRAEVEATSESKLAFARAYTMGALRKVQSSIISGGRAPENQWLEPMWGAAASPQHPEPFHNLVAMQMAELTVQHAAHSVIFEKLGQPERALDWLPRYLPVRAHIQISILSGVDGARPN